MTISLVDSLEEIKLVKVGCIGLLDKMRLLGAPDAHGNYPDTFRLIAIPMIYAVWERCFTLCHAVALRRLRDLKKHANQLDARQRALWLQKQGFYQRYIDLLRQAGGEDPGLRIKKGPYTALWTFLKELEEWSVRSVDVTVQTDELVMSFSNVNPHVVELNAIALGISDDETFQKIDFGRLHELVLRRNEIGHGGIITPPGNKEFGEIWKFTEDLVNNYCDAFEIWIKTSLADAITGADLRRAHVLGK